MRFSAKRSAYSDMPSFSSQSAICCIAAPCGFYAIRSGPAAQIVYHARQLIVAPAEAVACPTWVNHDTASHGVGPVHVRCAPKSDRRSGICPAAAARLNKRRAQDRQIEGGLVIRCHDWHNARRADPIAALHSMGIRAWCV